LNLTKKCSGFQSSPGFSGAANLLLRKGQELFDCETPIKNINSLTIILGKKSTETF
jgi:hypothetical protein